MKIYDIRPHPKDIKPSWVIRPIKTGYNPRSKIDVNVETSENFEAQRVIDLRDNDDEIRIDGQSVEDFLDVG